MTFPNNLKLGIFIPEFPSQTHAFFWQEICAIRDQGVQIQVFSTKQPIPGSCLHEFANQAASETHYLYPPKFGIALTQLVLHPFRVCQAFVYILKLNESSLIEKGKALGLLVCGAHLARSGIASGIHHLHVHSCANAAHIAALSSILGGPTYSLHLHGDLPVYGKDHTSKMKRARFVAAAARPMQLQVVHQAGVELERTYTFPMGIEISEESRAMHGCKDPGVLHLISVARLNKTKGHEFALKAVRKLIDLGITVHYTIVGSGSYEGSIKNVIEELGLSTHVTLTGTQGEREVRELLLKSDIFLLTSYGLGEASPVAVMEAMSVGLPVVCSIIGGTPDMITDGIDGYLVEQENVEQIADRLIQMGRSAELRERLGKAARDRAIQQFDVRRTADKLLSAIETHTSWRRPQDNKNPTC